MATGTLAPNPWFCPLDDNGNIMPAGKVYTYQSGTVTALSTYSDSDLAPAHANANPTILDSAGRCVMYLLPQAYKFVVKTSADVTVKTIDPVGAIPATNVNLDVDGTAGEAIAAGDCVYLSQGDGGRTAGRWYKSDGNLGTYSASTAVAIGFAPAAISSGEAGSIRVLGRVTDLSGLTAGTTYYISDTAGALSSTAGTYERAICVADSTTSVVISNWIVGHASGSAAGIVNLTTQTLGAGTKTLAGLHVNDPATFYPGTSTTSATIGGWLSTNVTPVGNVGGGTDDLMTYSLPANILSANGKAVRVTAWGSCANNANPKTITLNFGGTTVLSIASSTAFATSRWKFQGTIVRTGAATEIAEASGFTYQSDAGNLETRVGTASPAEDTTGAITIKCTATVTDGGGGINNDDVVQLGMIIEVVG